MEYAIEAIKLGSTAIGIQTGQGVVLAVEKRITSPLMEPASIEKIVEIDSHIGTSFDSHSSVCRMILLSEGTASSNLTSTLDITDCSVRNERVDCRRADDD